MSFLDGNSATFLAAIATLAVLCFFGTNTEKEEEQNANLFNHKDESDSNNFVRKLLSIISKRALGFLKREEPLHIKSLEVDNYEILSKAIAKSEDKINPYKQEMLDLADNLQFLTVNYQTEVFILRQDIEKFYRKITYYDLTEFLSSPFYSFLFCISILTLDCLDGTTPWCINTVSIVSIISFVYWTFIWLYYWLSIKDRILNKNNGIAYEFSFKKCLIHFSILFILTGGVCLYFNLSSIMATLICIFIIIIYATLLIVKFVHKKRNYSVFTHYFNLVHLGFVFFLIGTFYFIQYLFLDTEAIFSYKFAKIVSILFALFSCLIFPLVIPILRFKKEINKSIRKFRKLTKKYTDDNLKNRTELESYFDILLKLKALTPTNTSSTSK